MSTQNVKELLLAVFFDSTNNETDYLYVSFDGRVFRRISTPYKNTAFRDPGLMYYANKYWILNGNLVKDKTENRYQPKWGVSENLINWSDILYGNTAATDNNPIVMKATDGTYPYNKDGVTNNNRFDAWAPDVFAIDGNIYMFLSAGYWGESHGGKSEDDVMKQYFIKATQLKLSGNFKEGYKLVANYDTPMRVNFPEKGLEHDERTIKRGGKEDRIDASLLKGDDGFYYFAVKRFGTSYELWKIDRLDHVSDKNKWELINSDFVYEYEGASLVKFNGQYLFYCDKLSDTHGIHVAVASGLGKDQKWRVPEPVKFVESPGNAPAPISRRHGTVLHITDSSQISAILNVYIQQYGSIKESPSKFDMKKCWFRSNGKMYYRDENGEKKSCEYQENGNWYWFDEDGSMAKNKFVYIPGKNKWVYYTHTGNMAKGELYIGNEHNYCDNSPESAFHWYYFDLETGKRAESMLVTLPDKVVYYDENGWMYYGEKYIQNHWQYFEQGTGARATSKFVYLQNGDKWVYYDSNGWMVYGEQEINKHKYYFDPVTGKMAHGWITLPDGSRHHYDENTGIQIE